MNILVSACLLGSECRYDGTGKEIKEITELLKAHHLIPVCPEIYGGLPTPRVPSEIQKDRRVYRKDGTDVTKQYQKGAQQALYLAELYECKCAVLKERSPSCGNGEIYDGSFTGRRIAGQGITAEVLEQHGIFVFGETQIKELKEKLLEIEK